MILQGQVGPTTNSDGAYANERLGKLGDVIISDLHGRFYEQTYRGNLFSGGMSLTAINNVTYTQSTLGATCTPIAGVWNPSTSSVNLVILQVALAAAITAATATGPGPLVWAVSTGNGVISTGAAPWNRKTLAQSGSQAKNMANAALTGLTNALVVMEGSELLVGAAANFSEVGTAVGFIPAGAGAFQAMEGSLIVPPGGVLALLATQTPVAHSVAVRMLWEEVPV